jgi:hypothetical protein
MPIDILGHALSLGVRGNARVYSLVEVLGNVRSQVYRVGPLVSWQGGHGTPFLGEVVDEGGSVDVGLVELADQRQAAIDVGGQVFGEVQKVGDCGLCVRVGAHVQRLERVVGAHDRGHLRGVLGGWRDGVVVDGCLWGFC